MELAVRKQCAEVLNHEDGRRRNPIGGTDGSVSRAKPGAPTSLLSIGEPVRRLAQCNSDTRMWTCIYRRWGGCHMDCADAAVELLLGTLLGGDSRALKSSANSSPVWLLMRVSDCFAEW